jgi:hypothetical protein
MLEINTAEPLVPDPSPFEVEFAIASSKGINRQVVMKFKEEVKYYVLRSIS